MGVGVVVESRGGVSSSAKFFKLKLDGVFIIKPSSFFIFGVDSVLLFKAGLVEEFTRILKLILYKLSIIKSVPNGTVSTYAFIDGLFKFY